MAPVPKNTIEHFTHPGHKLVALNAATELTFLCDGCKTIGRGARFRCNACHFELHEFCGRCPAALSSFMHPLSLVVRKAQGARQNERTCDVCGDGVERLFFRCKDCEFDVHPLCNRLPQSLRHALHPLQPSTCSWCAVCRGACTTWRYSCGFCNVDIHLDCILALPPPPLPTAVPFPYGGG
ncbi:hypothetical protein RJ640_014355 [Escallonia rubra]|uniref:DC1 domain-containing protein n=1 Tax=Escallonia rubra TaxID=112253 RepID=A0AA88QPL0_9ASTE|nr:hypothetical protein RJ640_014355 [Escallonia rubra]